MLLAAHLFYRNFGVFPLHHVALVGVSQRISLNLFGREIIFEEFQIQPMCMSTVPVCLPEVRHRQTDRQTDARPILSQYRAVHNIAREKEIIIP